MTNPAMNETLENLSDAEAGLGQSTCSDDEAQKFIAGISRGVTITSHNAIKIRGGVLGGRSKDRVPFADKSGKWYVRSSAGVIRRTDNPTAAISDGQNKERI